MPGDDVQIADGVTEAQLADALRITYEAFAVKFRFGFRDADQFVRAFRGSVDRASCITATVNGQVAGLLTVKTPDHDFYDVDLDATFNEFGIIRTTRIWFNLTLLSLGESDLNLTADDLLIETLAVDARFRGMGIGTRLLQAAEARARAQSKRSLVLEVISENDGAIRLYERFGFRIESTERNFMVRWLTRSPAAHRMRKGI